MWCDAVWCFRVNVWWPALAGAVPIRQCLLSSLKIEMGILSYKGNLTCEQISCVRVAQGSMLKELYNHYSYEVQSF